MDKNNVDKFDILSSDSDNSFGESDSNSNFNLKNNEWSDSEEESDYDDINDINDINDVVAVPVNNNKNSDFGDNMSSNQYNQSNQFNQFKQSKQNKEENNVKIQMTTEGLSQDNFKTINLKKEYKFIQCDWCGKFYDNEMIITNENEVTCKHCMFCVNHSQELRLNFDKECVKKGISVALYIIECEEQHKTQNCSRYPHCYLCDYKLGTPILDILNPSMLGLDEYGLSPKFSKGQNNSQNKSNSNSSNEEQFNQKVILHTTDQTQKIKIPNKIEI